jgi:hypothetical protein
MPERERPHPRASYGRRVAFEDAADHDAIGEHVVVVVVPLAGWARSRRALLFLRLYLKIVVSRRAGPKAR